MDQWAQYHQAQPAESVDWAHLAQQWMAMKDQEDSAYHAHEHRVSFFNNDNSSWRNNKAPETDWSWSDDRNGVPWRGEQRGPMHSSMNYPPANGGPPQSEETWRQRGPAKPMFPSANNETSSWKPANKASFAPPPPPNYPMPPAGPPRRQAPLFPGATEEPEKSVPLPPSQYFPPPPPPGWPPFPGGPPFGVGPPPADFFPPPPGFFPGAPGDEALGPVPPPGSQQKPIFPGNLPYQMDAAARKRLPAWILEGLEKAEREKQKQIEKEEKLKQAEEERAKRRLESGKGKFDSSSDEEEEEDTERASTWKAADGEPPFSQKIEAVENNFMDEYSLEERQQLFMSTVRKLMTNMLIVTTNEIIENVIIDVLKERERLKAQKATPQLLANSSALAAIASFGDDSDASEDDEDAKEKEEDSDDVKNRKNSPTPGREMADVFKAPVGIPRKFSSKPDVSSDSSLPTSDSPPVPVQSNSKRSREEEEDSVKKAKKESRKHRSRSPSKSSKRRSRSRSRERRERKRSRSRERDREKERQRDRDKEHRRKDRKRSRSRSRDRRSRR